MTQPLLDALAARGYDTLTPVQEAVTDPDLVLADLLVSAQTGSGKTVGFGLAIGPTLLGETGKLGPAAAPLALIIAPTRELAFQVSRELGWLYAATGARVATCVGGMDMRDERRTLDRGAHIVVGTPGRLRDHIQRGSLDMSSLRAIVLDEADEMLDLGFREDLEFMLGEAPEDRRTLMFSATVPPMIATLAEHYQRDAVRVTTLSGQSQHADITYQALQVAQRDAENAIINVLRFHEAQNAIVFANTRAAVNRLTARFGNRGFQVVSLSGELSQSERTHALQAMRDGRARVCVATDVAARGIDLPNLELVVHAELPSNPEGLLHRSGRTGRAGRKGISALIVPPKATKKAERILKMAKVKAEWMPAPTADEIRQKDEERLLSDPVWSAEVSDEARAFAERLLAQHPAEAVAAAYLALYRDRHSAPEDLADPGAREPRKERAPFGPSVWYSLSVGRDDRAEPRWLLPLLLRSGGLEKDAIGAIRVQNSETFVEVAEASAVALDTALGDGGTLEEGVTAKRLASAPDLARGPSPAPRRDAPPPRKHANPHRGSDDNRPSRPMKPKSDWRPEASDGDPAPRKPRTKAKPKYDGEAAKPHGAVKSFGKPKPSGGKAANKAGDGAGKPHRQFDDAPAKGKNAAERSGKPGGKHKGKPSGKPFSKPSAKPAGKPKASASDTSKRFTPPGSKAGAKTRSGPGKRKPGGTEPPRRKRS